MAADSRVLELLHELGDSGCTPEEVCAAYPELLPEVRRRWLQICAVKADIRELFPTPGSSPVAGTASYPSRHGGGELPQIPGYEVEALLGRGGMGLVYKARHLRLNRFIALKMLITGAYAGPHERTRFQREAEAVASLRHTNIVQVYDVGDHEGSPYFTMELLEGGSLAQRLAGTPQPARTSAALLATLAEAMQVAHRGGIVHRDLKPANILLTADGTPKVADFGLARYFDGELGLTLTGTRIGTPSYMAPEQVTGKVGAIGPAADIYSLGVLLYEMLTGRPPFRGESASETERQVIQDEPVSPSRLNRKVPRDLETICLKCLEKDPKRRYPTAGALADDLGRYLNLEPIHARPAGRLERGMRWVLRHRSISAALAVVALLLATLVVGSILAATHFRNLQLKERGLTSKAERLAVEKEEQRAEAVEFQRREAALRLRAEEQGRELRQNLYIGQMNLAGQSMVLPGGLARVAERLLNWERGQPDLRGWEWYYLNGLCHRDLVTLRGHPDSVLDAAWSPDGRSIASAGGAGALGVWDAAGKREPLWLRGHGGAVYSVAWSPDGQRLASAGDDRTIRVWNANDGRALATLHGHETAVFAVAWNGDGTRLVSGGDDGTVRIWTIATDTTPHVLRGHAATVAGVAWSPNGKWIASASRDATVRIWDVDSKREFKRLTGHGNWVNHVAWRPDGQRLASASGDQTVKVWDPSTGSAVLTMRRHGLPVNHVAWSPDGTRLASAGEDYTIKVWPASGHGEPKTIRGHTNSVTSVAWSPDGARLLSASHDATVKVWDGRAKPETLALDGHEGSILTLAWSRGDRPLLASGDMAGILNIWNVPEHEKPTTWRGHDRAVICGDWDRDGRRLATAGFDQTVRIWDAARGNEMAKLVGHTAPVVTVQWSPDDLRLASAGEDRTVRIWNVIAGRCERTYRGHNDKVTSVAWSPDSKHVASASVAQGVRVWEVDPGRDTSIDLGHVAEVMSVAWSPDGRFLALGSSNHTARILDASTGKSIHVLRGHTAVVSAVTWNPAGTRLATASYDRSVKVWDVATGSETLTFGDHAAPVLALAWSADGMALASGGEDRVILVHDATPGYRAARAPAALPLLDRRLAREPNNPNDLRLRAEIQASRGEWEHAAAAARKFLELEHDQRWLALRGWVAGPYPTDLGTSFPPERATDPSGYGPDGPAPKTAPDWRPLPFGTHRFVDLGSIHDDAEQISAYVMFKVYSPERQPIAILLGSDDQVRLWLNGKQIHESLVPRVATADEDAVPAVLQSGWNTLLARVVNLTGKHALYLRISDAPGDMGRAHRGLRAAKTAP
jgi:WD40 repeat protein